jgi:hypothetical protein
MTDKKGIIFTHPITKDRILKGPLDDSVQHSSARLNNPTALYANLDMGRGSLLLLKKNKESLDVAYNVLVCFLVCLYFLLVNCKVGVFSLENKSEQRPTTVF